MGPGRRGPLPDPALVPGDAGVARVRRAPRTQGRRHGVDVRDRRPARPAPRAAGRRAGPPGRPPSLDTRRRAGGHPPRPQLPRGRLVARDGHLHGRGGPDRPSPRGAHRRLAGRGRHHRGRRTELGRDPVQRVPLAGGLLGRGSRPRTPLRPSRAPGTVHRRRVHVDAPTGRSTGSPHRSAPDPAPAPPDRSAANEGESP